MSIHIIQLGSKRLRGEGLRIGTVRHPPRGVLKSQFASHNWYDIWFPNLAPSPKLLKLAHAATTDKDFAAFLRKYRSEMSDPEKSRELDLLAALSHETNLSVGCYCDDESRCHRWMLRELLKERGAKLA